MKVVVDWLRCDALGDCVDACPEVFELTDADDVVKVLVAEPDESLREQLNRAVSVCPKGAITIEDWTDHRPTRIVEPVP